MIFKLYFILLILLFMPRNSHSQLYELSEKAAAEIIISLSEGELLSTVNLEKLKLVINSEFLSNEPARSYQISSASFDSVKKHLRQFESVSKNITPDSALVLFHQWYLGFVNIFYDYSKELFFSVKKTKILFFSTSLSCRCTLEMCKNQLIDILQFVKENNNRYDYWIVDAFKHNELQIKYLTLFTPSVIVLNPDNEVVYKIEYEETTCLFF